MTWNYRVCRHTEAGTDVYTLREVYYDNRSQDVLGWTSEPAYPHGDTPGELNRDLARMVAAFSVEMLDLDDLDTHPEEDDE